ncbi:MAG: hypothetical protein ACQPRI_06040 [Solitalea-like symbiont of Tyrophagus putrescentiae]
MTDFIENIEIPKFLLRDKNVSSKLHRQYALHLFVALFTIKARIANYYLYQPDILQRLNGLNDELLYNEVSYSINSVLKYVKYDFEMCIKWAYKIWKIIFVKNVQAANDKDFKLFPASKNTESANLDFIVSAAMLLLKMINKNNFKNIKIEKVREKTKNVLKYSQDKTTFQYIKLNKFSELSKFKISNQSIKSITICKKNMIVITPIEPFQDNDLVCMFLESATALRIYNFQEKLGAKTDITPDHEFVIPVFPWAYLFIKLI